MRNAVSSFRCDRRGGILVFFVVSLPVLVGTTGFVIDLVRAQTLQTELQRIADAAALAAGNELDFGSSALSRAESAATNLANSPRFAASAIDVQIVTPLEFYASLSPDVPTSDPFSAKFVRVRTIQRTSPGWFTRIIRLDDAIVDAEAWAASGATQPGCILALKTNGTGVTLSGGTTLQAHGCTVASNNTVTAPCGTKIETRSITYNSAAPPQACTGAIIPPPGSGATVAISRQYTDDPFLGNTHVSAATARLATVSALTAPAAPIAPGMPTVPTGVNVDLQWGNNPTLPAGCSGVFTSSGTAKWTITCAPGGTYNFGNFTMGWFILDFNVNGSSLSKYNFKGPVSLTNGANFGPGTYNFGGGFTTNGNSSFAAGTYTVAGNLTTNGTTNFGGGTYTLGGNLAVSGTATFGAGAYNVAGLISVGGGATANFGSGTYNIVGGLQTGGGTRTTFGAGTFNIGQMANSCGGGRYSICNENGNRDTPLSFGGPSTFNLRAGVYISGGSSLSMGTGVTNSYWLGASTDGYAIRTGGGATISLSDATGASSLARFLGNVSISGGSCLRMPAAANQDIKGSLDLGGGIIMGSGVYTMTGYATFGAAYGGNVNCWGSSIGIQALNSTFVLGAAPASTTGSCNGRSFCVGAGYSSVTMTAPITGSRLLVVGPMSGTGIAAGASFIQGAANQKLSGVFYFPNGPINLNGGASVMDGATHCLQIVGSEITLTGGTSAASACIDSVSPTGGLALVR